MVRIHFAPAESQANFGFTYDPHFAMLRMCQRQPDAPEFPSCRQRWVAEEDGLMALFEDIPVVGEVLSGGSWVTGLAIGVGAVVVLPLVAPILRPLAKTAIKGG